MLIFLGGDYSQFSNEQMDQHMQKWLAWVQELSEQQRYVSGEALLPGGKTVAGPGKVVTDGPFTEGKEIIGGYFVVLAKNLDEAVDIAKASPDYAIGGIVEVREVQKFDI